MPWKELLKTSYKKAKESEDPSTQNAALLVSDRGDILVADTNRFPEGVKTNKERWERPLKYKFIEHAERNICYVSAKQGIKTKGLTMVCPWAACSDCARAIIQSGIIRLVTHQQAHERSPEFWAKEIEIAFTMLKEAGVEVVMYNGKIGAEDVLHSGQLWTP